MVFCELKQDGWPRSAEGLVCRGKCLELTLLEHQNFRRKGFFSKPWEKKDSEVDKSSIQTIVKKLQRVG